MSNYYHDAEQEHINDTMFAHEDYIREAYGSTAITEDGESEGSEATQSKPIVKEKHVSFEDFDRIVKKFPHVQVRSFQASLSKETFCVKWVDGKNEPFDLIWNYPAAF
tara:strand:+ start:63 stop:386 length:324 start_codon:yes stop_codon:yes gene_type:complete